MDVRMAMIDLFPDGAQESHDFFFWHTAGLAVAFHAATVPQSYHYRN
jgi:hypothetical protein